MLDMSEIKPHTDPGCETDPNCLILHIYPNPNDREQTLATLEWVQHSAVGMRSSAKFTDIWRGKAMSPDEARSGAETVAEKKGIPTVYIRDDQAAQGAEG